MGDRTDLDALLIGALYGELAPADEARLAAHLESHPADRSALADLAHTRDAVRASRVFAFQFEPPQQVSTLLLQEAARRLPRKDATAGGWFYRFTRLVLGHPTMAVVGAAAMFVLVIGVAGTLYRRNVPQYAESAAPAAMSSSGSATVASTTAAGAVAPESVAADSPAVDVSPAPPPAAAATPPTARPAGLADRAAEFRHADNAVADPQRAPAPSTKPDSFRVGLEEGQLAVRQRAQEQQREAAKGAYDKQSLAKSEAVAPDDDVARPEPKLKKQAGIVVRTPEAKPKELEEDSTAAQRRSNVAAQQRDESRNERAEASNKVARGGAAGGFAAPPTGAAAGAPAENQAQAIESVAASGRVVAPRASAPASPAPPPPARPAPTQAASDGRFDGKADQAKDAQPSDEKAGGKAGEDTVAAWARKQHDQVKALVKSNNCLGAANVAVGIYGRAPAYYTTNVATDRELKTCMAYLNRERDREDRNRAAKRALSNEPAAPAAKK